MEPICKKVPANKKLSHSSSFNGGKVEERESGVRGGGNIGCKRKLEECESII